MSNVVQTSVEHDLQLTQKMLHSLRLLHMGIDELKVYVDDVISSNPVLEYKKPLAAFEPAWDSGEQLDRISDPHNHIESLSFYLEDQIDRLCISKKKKDLCKALILMIDERGYLHKDDIKWIKVTDWELTEACEIIKSLDPAGIGAESLSECLLLQLIREQGDTSDARLLAEHFLPQIAENDYCTIEQKTGLTRDRILKAIEKMRNSFQGNVRQLANIIEYATIVCDDNVICVDDLPDEVRRFGEDGGAIREKQTGKNCIDISGLTLQEVEKKVILMRLEENKGHQRNTARSLDISERSLRNKINEYK